MGSFLTYVIIDLNHREMIEPLSELGDKLELCDTYGKIAEHNTTIHNSRIYFNCVRNAYNFTGS